MNDYLKVLDGEVWTTIYVCKSCMNDWIENMDNTEKIFIIYTLDEYPRCQYLIGSHECGNKTKYIVTYDFRREGLAC